MKAVFEKIFYYFYPTVLGNVKEIVRIGTQQCWIWANTLTDRYPTVMGIDKYAYG